MKYSSYGVLIRVFLPKNEFVKRTSLKIYYVLKWNDGDLSQILIFKI